LGKKGPGIDNTVFLRAIDPKVPNPVKSVAGGKAIGCCVTWIPATAALILQNSVPTVLRAYEEGSPTTQEEELGQFFEGFAALSLAKGSRRECTGALRRRVHVVRLTASKI